MARKAPRKTRTRRQKPSTTAAAGTRKSQKKLVPTWEDDPGDPNVTPAPTPIQVPAPTLGAQPLPTRIGGAAPAAKIYQPGTPEFRYYACATSLRRGSDFWGGISPRTLMGNRQDPARHPRRRGGPERLLHAWRVRGCARPALLPRGRRHADLLFRREPRRRLPRDGPRDPRRAAARAVRRADDRSRGLPRVVRRHERHPDGAAGRLVPPARADRHAGRAEPQLAPVAARRTAGRGDSRGAPGRRRPRQPAQRGQLVLLPRSADAAALGAGQRAVVGAALVLARVHRGLPRRARGHVQDQGRRRERRTARGRARKRPRSSSWPASRTRRWSRTTTARSPRTCSTRARRRRSAASTGTS